MAYDFKINIPCKIIKLFHNDINPNIKKCTFLAVINYKILIPLAFLLTTVIFILMHQISKGCHSVFTEIRRDFIKQLNCYYDFNHIADILWLRSPNSLWVDLCYLGPVDRVTEPVSGWGRVAISSSPPSSKKLARASWGDRRERERESWHFISQTDTQKQNNNSKFCFR